MEKYQTSIELLNKALGSEIATSLQYTYFHVHCEDSGYEELARMFRNISIAEMRHIEELSERILFLEGEVDMNPAYRIKAVPDVEGMLRLAAELERKTINDYNEWSRQTGAAADAGTHRMFQDLVVEEEEHLDRFQVELQNMTDYGKDYLVLQSMSGSRNANRHKAGDWEKS